MTHMRQQEGIVDERITKQWRRSSLPAFSFPARDGSLILELSYNIKVKRWTTTT